MLMGQALFLLISSSFYLPIHAWRRKIYNQFDLVSDGELIAIY